MPATHRCFPKRQEKAPERASGGEREATGKGPGVAVLPAREEKSPAVAGRAWKFWERMPERPAAYAAPAHISQVRKGHGVLQKAQRERFIRILGF
jgi:hypothetical protein